ncbi:MAG: Stp1/IreP family PP2C-type Ser/Thr phosphatase [Actinomycetota bacterium]|nr:Stp1/IreP family PP2C-type Ser/Thr phosphatase [Actinomycetota bacterium]
MTVIRSGSASDVGRVRSMNEDRLLESVALFAVADGMGGHAGGEVASDLAIGALQRAFTAEPSERGLIEAVRRANQAVWERSLEDPQVRGMGTTITAAALVPTGAGDRLVVVNVGDSRAYRFAAGDLRQMTRDHSVAEELVARGELSEAEAAVHPQRHILTRALGIGPEVEVDAWELSPGPGERFVLCSDGLTNEVGDDQIAEVLRRVREPRKAADALVRLANEHGGSDNITVVVVDVVVADPGPGGDEHREPVALAVSAAAAGAGALESDGTGARRASTSTPDQSAGTDPRRGPAPSQAHGAERRAQTLSGSEPPPASATVLVPAGSPTAAPSGEDPSGVDRGAEGTEVGAPSARPRATREATGHSAAGAEPAAAGAGSAPEGERSDPIMARHVTGAISDVMGRPRVAGRAPAVPPKRRARRLTVRVVVFVVLVAAVAAGAWAVLRFYAEDAYYVGLRHDRVVVYQGRPGGFLGFRPHVVGTSSLTASELLVYRVPELRSGVQEPSRQAAEQFVVNLRVEKCAVDPTSPVCSRSARAAASYERSS